VFAQPGDSRLRRAASACSERPSRATCHGYMIADCTSTDQASAVEMRAPLYLAYGLTLHAARRPAADLQLSQDVHRARLSRCLVTA
jgi:hypothetical protein